MTTKLEITLRRSEVQAVHGGGGFDGRLGDGHGRNGSGIYFVKQESNIKINH